MKVLDPHPSDADRRVDSVIRDALKAVRLQLRMPLAYLTIFEGDSVRFSYVSTDVDPPFLAEGTIRPAEGTYCKAVRDGDLPEFLKDTNAHPFSKRMELTRAGPIGAVISIPIQLQSGQCHAMFCCLDHVARPELTARDHAVMTAFASLVIVLLDRNAAPSHEQDATRRWVEQIIAQRAFSLAHQPIVSLTDRSILLYEALCRFGGPTPLPPDEVFARARTVGLGEDLELSVFRETLRQSGDLARTRGLSMNLSPDVMIGDAFMDILGTVPSGANRVIELTEHVDFGDYDALAIRMNEIRSRGFRVAVDDFGNGHASLNAVLQLQPDIVKLDRALISRIETDTASQSLIQAITAFSRDIGATLLAEGIEHGSQVDKLRDLNVTLGQGYYFGRPQVPGVAVKSSSAA